MSAGTSASVIRDLISGVDVKTVQGESIVGPGNLNVIDNVDQYSNLPSAAANIGKYYWVRNTQGTKWLPGTLGGTFYNKGLYYSDGTSWTNTDVPFQATQAEVDAGTNNTNFVTPLTLKNTTLRKHYGNLSQTTINTLTGMVIGDTVFNTTYQRTQEYTTPWGWVGVSERSVAVQALASSLPVGTYYIGVMASAIAGSFGTTVFKAPYTGKITKVFLRTRAAVAGDRSISVFIRINDTTDYLVQTINDTNANREFINLAMNANGIPVTENVTTIAVKVVVSGGTTDATQFLAGGTIVIQ